MRKLRLFWLAITALISGANFAGATVCDCRPEFETEAEASGVCSKIKDDKRWCKIKFGTGDTHPKGERNREFTERLSDFGIPPVEPSIAVQGVTLPPEKWTVTTVRESLAGMFAIALWDTAPQRVKEVVSVIREEAERFLNAAKSEGQTFRAGRYEVDAARGCVQLLDGSFSAMVRTPFARSFDSRAGGGRRCGRP